MNAVPPRRLLALVVLCLAGVPGCDLVLGADGEDLTIEGDWVLVEAVDFDERPRTYLRVTSTAVTLYEKSDGPCYAIYDYTILSRDGDSFTLEAAGIGQDVWSLEVQEDQLVWLETLKFEPTSDDLTALQECSVLGVWMNDNWPYAGDEVYLRVATDQVEFLTSHVLPEGTCYYGLLFDVVARNGYLYTLKDRASGDTYEMGIRVEVLAVGTYLMFWPSGDHASSIPLWSTNADLTTLPRCAF